MSTTITNLPGISANTNTKINLAQALTKAVSGFHMFPFMTNENLIDKAYKSASAKGAIAQVMIKPVLSQEDEETIYDGTTELSLSDYETASYGKIDVVMEYAATKKFGLPSPSVDFSPLELEQMEAHYLESSFKDSIIPKMFKTINGRLRTSAFAENLGTSGQALNAEVFKALRNAADAQGFENERLHVRVHPDFYDAITEIPEFQTYRGTKAVAGNTAQENDTITNTKFSVYGKYNIDFVKDRYYLRPTPASDPVATATIKTSAVVPFRGLSITDKSTQSYVTDPNTGLSFRYDKSFIKTNIGEVIGGRVQAYYGFKELSGDINNAGALQTAPIFNIKGGKSI